tara:strand:- start:1303 stop:1584 length:282 start_codon:yes stop_codon:yes gene_type:complete
MFNKKMLDIMFIKPEFAPLCTRSRTTKWSSSERALNSMRESLKSGGLYMQEIVSATSYSQPSVSKAMKILESNNEVTSKRTAKNQPVFFELVA